MEGEGRSVTVYENLRTGTLNRLGLERRYSGHARLYQNKDERIKLHIRMSPSYRASMLARIAQHLDSTSEEREGERRQCSRSTRRLARNCRQTACNLSMLRPRLLLVAVRWKRAEQFKRKRVTVCVCVCVDGTFWAAHIRPRWAVRLDSAALLEGSTDSRA